MNRLPTAVRISACLAAVAVAGALTPAVCAAPVTVRPNVIVILSDDQGYGDVGVQGCKDIRTPHLDSIARDGVRLTNGYVSAPQCSPTRAGLMTGRYQQRFGHESNRAVPDSSLDLKQTTLAAVLKRAGYATGLIGKWHLGIDGKHHPQSRGFDEFFGFLGGANPYLPRGPRKVVPRILRGRKPVVETEYLTDAFGREAVAFIERHRTRPFFLYLAFNAPHGPLQATEKYLRRFPTIKDPKRRTYAAMVSAMDDAVGRVLGTLRQAGLDEKTLIFYLSDNGGPTEVNASSNAPLRGVKGEVREGGIRVPFFVRWKGRLPAGKTFDQPAISLDIFPTVLAAAGIKPPADARLDGVNLLPWLTGKRTDPPHDVLYWRFNFPARQPARHKWAIRQGDWKLFTDLDANRKRKKQQVPETGRVMLVNLAKDIGERRDLSTADPEKAKRLRERWKKWNAQLVTPKAPEPRRRRKKSGRIEQRDAR
jgi:arylsulfatase A-like enzyme